MIDIPNTGRILCITDKRGRIQCNRMELFQKLMPKLNLDVFTIGEDFDPSDYSLVYYSNYKLFRNRPCKQKKIASITSHKGLRKKSKKETIKLLKQFDGLSVNNKHLRNAYRPIFPNIYYTPNGVESDFFTPTQKKSMDKIVFGWVGNRDRKAKNFKKILIPLIDSFKDHAQVKIELVAPLKKYKKNKLKTQKEMRDYYRSIHFLLITSETEGTPNPGLEAMSCGVPVLTTRVGNMTDIVEEPGGINGYYVNADEGSFRTAMLRVLRMDISCYRTMSIKARESIEDRWSWHNKINKWRNFFRSFI